MTPCWMMLEDLHAPMLAALMSCCTQGASSALPSTGLLLGLTRQPPTLWLQLEQGTVVSYSLQTELRLGQGCQHHSITDVNPI
jgi:hypothetical protein